VLRLTSAFLVVGDSLLLPTSLLAGSGCLLACPCHPLSSLSNPSLYLNLSQFPSAPRFYASMFSNAAD
jgi:hypothetical protein